MTEMKFEKAQRKKAKAKIAIAAPSGGGKTYSALLLAKGIAKETGDKIAVIDTERGSASMYDNIVDFDVLDLAPPYTPERYMQAIKAAETAGYGICVIDSATHEWSGTGGCLEINEELARARYKGNTWSAWSDTTPRHRDFIDAQLHSPMHIIATFRSKTETVQNNDKKVVKLGMKAETRDNVEYEYTIFFELTHDGHFATASKDRTELFEGRSFVITPDTGKEIVSWLNSGKELKPEAVKVEAPAPEVKKLDPIVVPEKPIELAYVNAVEFGKTMAAAIQASKDDAEVTDWLGQNEAHLKTLGEASPKMKKRIDDLVNKQRESFVIDEDIPPAIRQQHAEAKAAGKI